MPLNIFASYRDEQKPATYKEIKSWIKENRGLSVTSLSISQAKKRCGLLAEEYSDYHAKGENRVRKLSPEHEAAIRDAFMHFGMVS